MTPRRRSRDHDLPTRVYRKHGAYYLVTTAGKWVRLGKTLPEALSRYAELEHGPYRRPQSMVEVFDRYEREVIPTKAPRTQRDNHRELALLRQAFGHMLPDQITAQDVYAYMDARQAPVRANREKSLLSHVYSYAIRWGAASGNPCLLVKRNPEKPRDRYVTDAEFQAVYDVAAPAVRVAMMLSLLTGLRQGDVLRLTWHAVTDAGLEVRQGKTGRALLFEWTPELRAVLDEARRLGGSVQSMTIVCNRQAQRYTSDGFATMWQRAVKKAIGARTLGRSYQYRDLRAKTGSESDDERLLGHQDPRVLRRHYQRAPVRVTPIKPRVLAK